MRMYLHLYIIHHSEIPRRTSTAGEEDVLIHLTGKTGGDAELNVTAGPA